MNNKEQLLPTILNIIKNMQDNPTDWVNLADIGPLLSEFGIQYKEYGYRKLRPFLNEFADILDFDDVCDEGKPRVCYVRLKTIPDAIVTETKNEEEFASVSDFDSREIHSGRIKEVRSHDEFGFEGQIETEDRQLYYFNRWNWINKNLKSDDIHAGEEVEFDLKPPNKNNKVFPKNIRFKGKSFSANQQSNLLLPQHGFGDLRQFVYLKSSILKSAFIRVLEDFYESVVSIDKMIDTIKATYVNLSDGDFEFDPNNETLIFFSGFKKDGGKIYLYCTKNTESDKTEWYCDRIMYNRRIIGGAVFDKINADWYDILDDLKEFNFDFPKDTEAKTVIEIIEQRCMAEDSLIWLDDNGYISVEDNAEQLFAPTGYFIDGGKELYLSCSKRRGGIKGAGWYYDYITYKNAPIEIYDKKDWLQLWADFKWNDVCESIANQTLEEKWSFGERKDYSILRNYLNYIFAHQWGKKGVGFSEDEKYAAFNTGLPDASTFKFIYAFFEKIEPDTRRHPLVFSPQYRLKNFVLSDRGGDGKELKKKICPLPPPPQFFESRSTTVWELEYNDNNQLTMPGFDDTHILIQRCDRLPLDFYRRAACRSERLQCILDAETSEWQKFKEIRNFLRPVCDNKDKADTEVTQAYQELYLGLEQVISKAVRKLSWNWRAVVPCYNPEKEEPCFLLPVSFCDANRPDRAMIASIDRDSGKVQYNIHTVLPLEWAYLDARLVCRPESEWLVTDNIT